MNDRTAEPARRPGGNAREATFAEQTERHRRELRAHCYRMLGSFDEAEDLVQETMLRAWRHRESYAGRSSLRTWLYTIATNACLDQLRRRPRQPSAVVDRAGQPEFVEIGWLEPFPDSLAAGTPDPAAPLQERPDVAAVATETIELAFLIAVQQLPPRQRAVLILREVVDWSAADTATALDMTVAAVNSAQQRAKATLREIARRQDRETMRVPAASAAERELVRRYVDAHAAGDPGAIVELLREEVRIWMPPDPQFFLGRAAAADLFQELFVTTPVGEFRLLPAGRSNGHPAVANYLKRPGETQFLAVALDVIRLVDGRIDEIVVFEKRHFPRFGLPEVFPG
ncbi:RNA polymerase subunit sigma-70 [Nakamurella sp.]|uniref:RNA polymerase subunit sigma-70 n=1 Tax=Nakamurella sp. TaxID=1869182 RepID=UPI0037836B86